MHNADVATTAHVGRSFLIIVPRARVDLYQSLKRSFADNARATVILDRRFRDRRVRVSQHDGGERRNEDRRRRPEVDGQLKTGRWVTVPIVPTAPSSRDLGLGRKPPVSIETPVRPAITAAG